MISPFSYITIPAFAVTHLKLNGNELILYSLIYNHSWDGIHKYFGTINDMSEWLNVSRQTVFNILKSLISKDLIFKENVYINGYTRIVYSALLPQVKNMSEK